MSLRNALLLLGVAAALVVAFVLVALTGECGGTASCAATAHADGRTYQLASARNMDIEPADLVWYATVSRRAAEHTTFDENAYRLGDLDPTKVLVMRLAPGQVDDVGALGDYLLLVSDASGWPLTCPYFQSADPLRPDFCE